MADIGKRLSDLLGSEQGQKIKNIGAEALGEVLDGFKLSKDEGNQADTGTPPPSGERFDAEPPAPSIPPVDRTPPEQPKVQAASVAGGVADKIIELNKLREQGLLTDDEFNALKKDLLKL
jgi:hypothetical protein